MDSRHALETTKLVDSLWWDVQISRTCRLNAVDDPLCIVNDDLAAAAHWNLFLKKSKTELSLDVAYGGGASSSSRSIIAPLT